MRSSIALKNQETFRKVASILGDHLLISFVEKCNLVFCRDGRTVFQIVYKQNSIFVPEDKHTLLDDFCVWIFFWRE
jgi:hypothetical protein